MLKTAFRKIVRLLNRSSYEYLIIGGIASNVVAEPRLTGDIDICLFIQKKNVPDFLTLLSKTGFNVNKKENLKNVKVTGHVRVFYKRVPIDFIIASTPLEKSVLEQGKNIKYFNVNTKFPSPEGFVLLKLVPGRHQDYADIDKTVRRHGNKLDTKYLEKWAQNLTDISENMRYWNDMQKIIRDIKESL